MPKEIVSQTANAEGAEPAPAAEKEVKQAEGAESAPAGLEPNAEPANTENSGAEPAGNAPGGEEPKVRLSELTVQRKRRQEAEKLAAERAVEAAYWRGRAESGSPGAKQEVNPEVNTEKAPVLDDFDDFQDFVVAKTKFELRQEQKIEQVKQQQLEKNISLEKKFGERIMSLSSEIPDLQETIKTAKLPIFDEALVLAIKKSELGPQMVYFMAKNPDEAARFARMDKDEAIMELGGMKGKIQAMFVAKTKTATTAPAPFKPVSGNGVTVETDLADLPMAEYAKRRLAQK